MKVILKKFKKGVCIEAKLYSSKEAAEREKKKYLASVTMHTKVKDGISANIVKA